MLRARSSEGGLVRLPADLGGVPLGALGSRRGGRRRGRRREGSLGDRRRRAPRLANGLNRCVRRLARSENDLKDCSDCGVA
ncbi:MAG: hypothetical protein ACK56I_07390, partial [bacterium]